MNTPPDPIDPPSFTASTNPGSAQMPAIKTEPIGVAVGAEDGLKLTIRNAAQLILKAVPTQGIADGSVFPSPTDAYHPVDGTYPVAHSNAGILRPFASLWPMVGVSVYEGEQVLVVGPWFISFEQLSLHGYLSIEEVQQLQADAKKIEHGLYRVIRRKSAEIRAQYESTLNR